MTISLFIINNPLEFQRRKLYIADKAALKNFSPTKTLQKYKRSLNWILLICLKI